MKLTPKQQQLLHEIRHGNDRGIALEYWNKEVVQTLWSSGLVLWKDGYIITELGRTALEESHGQ